MTKYPSIKEKFEKHRIDLYETRWKLIEGNQVEGDVVYFGQKIKVGDELFTLVDWGHVWSFIEQSLEETEKRVREETLQKCLSAIEETWREDVSVSGGHKLSTQRLIDRIRALSNNDDLKDLGLKPRKINFKKIEKLAKRIKKAMEKENK